MAYKARILAESVMGYKIPTLGIPEGFNHLPVAIAGALIVLFSIEHIIALISARTSCRRGTDLRGTAPPDRARHGTDDPLHRLSPAPDPRRAGRVRDRARRPSARSCTKDCRSPSSSAHDVGDDGVLVPRDSVLHLRRRAHALRRHRATASSTFAKSLVGHIRGGLGMSNVVACTLFGGVSGSPVADVSAMGAVMIPMMKKEGYDADYAVNVTTHAALVGALMPTCAQHDHLLARRGRQGVDRGTDPGRPAAGARPHDLQPGRRLCGRDQARLPGRHVPRLGRRARVSLAAAAPGLFVVVIIVTGILSGVFTATESASVAVLYALMITDVRVPQPVLGRLPQGRRTRGEEDGRRAAADRHVGHARLPDEPLQRRRAHGQGAVEPHAVAVDDLHAGERHPVPAGYVPRHGGDDPHLHADLPADLPCSTAWTRCSSG